jgi:hypothetical protein
MAADRIGDSDLRRGAGRALEIFRHRRRREMRGGT